MISFDPYGILDIRRDAGPQAVKTAYRRKVQSAHPDRGGDPDVFILVVKAFGILSDPDARRLFDETGIIDEGGVRDYRREVATILADMFDAAVETAVSTGLGLERVDFIRQMTQAVQTGLVEARSQLRRVNGEIGALQALRNRIRRHDSERNLFVERLDAQIATKTEQHAQIRRRQGILETALAELDSYDSATELIVALETESRS
jgi:curved DNA-binding protein CbpA